MFNTTTNGTKIEEDEVPDITDPFFLIETLCIIWFTFELTVRYAKHFHIKLYMRTPSPKLSERKRNISLNSIQLFEYNISLSPSEKKALSLN